MRDISTETAKIGIFDSGIGGLSILREIRSCINDIPLSYIADQAHVPYGDRMASEILLFSRSISRFLIKNGAKMIVVACNTASAAALQQLRHDFPDVPFVGMEPAVKPAAQTTQSKVVGILATPATFQGKMYHTLVEKFASNVRILNSTLPGMVQIIENGKMDDKKAYKIVEKAVLPMVEEGADTIVLGCTHFPFILPLIRNIAGPKIEVIDPAPAIAKRTAFLVKENKKLFEPTTNKKGEIFFATSGDPEKFQAMIRNLLGISSEPKHLRWAKEDIAYSEETNHDE